eukprot:TRINITY_DN6497_c0_g1_i1.p1 TRINITY_DN6497_c0_g1~~TRINITY_DN6497_c0_g1_i1.p1  ORF type:complete len:238 (+),score=35.35 TRINITY_DN6497_c0_g1_i1:147-860(+)
MAVQLEKDGNVFVLQLVGEGEHRFNPTSIAAIHKALDEVEQSEGYVALVTTNDGRFFSNGLDLAWLQKNPTQLLSFMQSFMDLLWRVLHFPVPTVAAINGHAAAGGFMLALAHDYRVMRTDKGVLYLSEVDIGLPLTPGMNAIVRCKMSPSVFRSAALFGTKFNGRDALKSELVDETGENVEATLATAMAKAKQLAARKWERTVYKSLKLEMYKEALKALKEGGMGYGTKAGAFSRM